MNSRRAIALISGGLDSALAARIVKDQGVEVIGLHLVSPFGCREEVAKTAADIGIPLIFRDKGEAYLDLEENPRYGYGSAVNPCIDCRIYMFHMAEKVLKEEKADFVITGEVVGQRPMSQHHKAMDTIDRKSPLDGLVLRPLCAHAMEPTIPEQQGWVNREAFFGITGRSRKEQLQLAKDLGLSAFSAPGGGCLLTEQSFAPRLKDFFAHRHFATSEERLAQSQMLRLGRHFRIDGGYKVVLGRNEKENHELEDLHQRSHGSFLKPFNFEGPAAIVLGDVHSPALEFAGSLIARYGKGKELETRWISVKRENEETVISAGPPVSEEFLERARI